MAAQVSQYKRSFSTFNGRGKPFPANDYGRGKSSYRGGRFDAPRQCTQCGTTNHTINTCFLIHGLPPSFKSKRVHNVTTEDQAESHSSTLGVSQEQIHGLLALLSQCNPTTTYSTDLVRSDTILRSEV
ncbi:hypothetical protein V8G54_022801 [Vigna mungo]|uniref:Uncharacterized protein n=1 Tax=Vigna mungo TaxID=3915 RepID=A0AAQ3N1Z1_VIGMU